MKKSILKVAYILPLVFALSLTSCKDDEEEAITPETSVSTACNGGDGFCMNYGGTEKSGPAKLRVLNSNKVRVFWENGTGSAFEQVELDIYGIAPGTYKVNDGGLNGSAFVQYFASTGGVNNPAYGTVTVTAADTITGITGTFNVTMKDSTKITNGIFKNVVK